MDAYPANPAFLDEQTPVALTGAAGPGNHSRELGERPAAIVRVDEVAKHAAREFLERARKERRERPVRSDDASGVIPCDADQRDADRRLEHLRVHQAAI